MRASGGPGPAAAAPLPASGPNRPAARPGGARGQLPRSPKRQSRKSLNGTSDERAAAHWHRHSQPAADGHAALACQ